MVVQRYENHRLCEFLVFHQQESFILGIFTYYNLLILGPTPESDTISLGENFRDSLEHSMNPELQKVLSRT